MKAPRSSARESILETSFQRRHDASFAWRTRHDALHSFGFHRGIWTMCSVDEAPLVRDDSPQGRSLTGVNGPDFQLIDWIPTPWFDGTSYLTRADEAGLRVTGNEAFVHGNINGLTAGGWFKPDSTTPAANQTLTSKWGASGNYEWRLELLTTGLLRFSVSQNGVGVATVSSSVALAPDCWTWCVGQYIRPVTTLRVWVNAVYTDLAIVYTSIFNGVAPFNISGQNNGTQLYTGYAADCFYAANYTPPALMTAYYSLISPVYGHTL